jgi:putative tryptophan/tyrosine transport system substrate-binding protein
MRRREFIAALGGAAAWPVVARAQQPDRVRRIGALLGWAEADAISQEMLAAFKQGLASLGWSEGSNLHIDLRWTAGDINRAASFAKELVALQPDVILTGSTPATAAIHRETQTIPIVFVQVTDPIGSGFVESLSHPGGNITGFLNLEATLAEKWLELLKEIAPNTKQVAVMFNPQTAPYAQYYLKPIENMAPKLNITIVSSPVRDDVDIQTPIAELARDQGSGLIAMNDSFIVIHRKSIEELAARHQIPTIYPTKEAAMERGLISYGVDAPDLFSRSALYVDRILHGAKPSELPVQGPINFELVINLKAAKALGLQVPPSLLATADEVIE